MLLPASDSVDEAVAAARVVLANLGDLADGSVLHASNNVVFGTNTLVAKVTRDEALARTEYLLSRHASERGAPALAPAAAPIVVGDFTVVVWPRAWPHENTGRTDTAHALHRLHQAWREFAGDLPTLKSRLQAAQQLVTSDTLHSILEQVSVSRLSAVVERGIQIASTSTLFHLHGEPHDANFLRSGERTVVIDFEAACLGPMEWDAAFFADDIVTDVWPNVDRRTLGDLRPVVSAVVSIYCWRHLAVRGPEEIMMSHAQHHLARVMAADA